MRLKPSKYNYEVVHDEKVYIYNTLHRSFIALPKSLWAGFCEGNSDAFSLSELCKLQDHGILLPDSVDERYIFRDIMQSNCIRRDEISLFLSMTSMCNLACSYCYQDFRVEDTRKRFIDSAEIDVLCRFLQDSTAKKINVVYFGGEPTLDTEQLIAAIQKINNLAGKTINNAIITNGCSISSVLLEEIKAHKPFMVQVTLDGDRDLHDTVRVTHDKTGTYDRIIRSIDALADAIPGSICVRINVSSKNFAPYKRLLDALSERYNNRIGVSLAAVFNGQKKTNEPELKDTVDILELYEYAEAKGYDAMPPLEYAPCIATMRGAFAVDENLNVYTCPARLYEKSVGVISKDAKFIISDNEWYEALYDRKKCVETCMYGGLCYGGCIMSDMECKKDIFDQLLPYVVNSKIKKNREVRKQDD